MGLVKGVPINRYCDQHHPTPRQRLELIGAGKFGPEGKLVDVAASAAAIRLVDPGTGRDFASLEDPSQDATSPPIFTPDGTNVSAFSSGKVNGIRVRDLRLIRQLLAKMGLDWDAPPCPPADPGSKVLPPPTGPAPPLGSVCAPDALSLPL